MELKQPIAIAGPGHYTALLIVPYGIETHSQLYLYRVSEPFNRTLWN